MNNMRKLSKKVLVLALLAGLVLCYVVPSVTFAAKTELNFVQIRGPRYSEASQAIAEKYMKVNTDVNIEILELPWEQHVAKIALDSASGGTSYDLIFVDYSLMGGYIDGGYLLNLDDFLAEYPEYWAELQADIYPSVRNLYVYKGSQWSIPLDANAQIFYYRKDLLRDAGLNVPSTYEEIYRVAPKLHNPPDTYVIGFQAKGWTVVDAWLTLFFSAGGEFWDENFVPLLNSDEAIKATEALNKLYKWAPEDVMTWNYFDVVDAMGSAGILALWPVGGWGDNLITNPDVALLADKCGVEEVPALDGGRGVPQGGYGLGINARIGDKKIEETWKFIMFLTAKENQREYVAAGGQPARISALNDPVSLAQTPYLKALGKVLKYAKGRPIIPEYNSVTEIIGMELLNTLLGSKSIEDAMGAANKAVYELMIERGRIE